jgi:DNA-directed RNA polymerase specialized sigma24 family protein
MKPRPDLPEYSENLSPELDWMLQSRQPDPDQLAAALVEAFYRPLYTFVLFLTGDPLAASSTARETLAKAVRRAERYHPAEGLRVWIYRLALETGARGRLSKRVRTRLFPRANRPIPTSGEPVTEEEAALRGRLAGLKGELLTAAALFYLADLSVDEAAVVLQLTWSETAQRLKEANQYLAAEASQDGSPVEGSLAPGLQTQLKRLCPAPKLSEIELALLSEGVSRQAARGGRLGSGPFLNEISLLGVFALLVIALVWGSNELLPGLQPTPTPQPDQEREVHTPPSAQTPPAMVLLTPTPSPTNVLLRSLAYYPQSGETLRTIAARFGISLDDLLQYNGFTPFEPIPPDVVVMVPVAPQPDIYWTPTLVPTDLPRVPGLSRRSTPLEIFTYLLLRDKLWHTLWAELVLLEHGPQGYVGPPKATRVQVWAAQPGLTKVLAGEVSSWPDYHSLTSSGKRFTYYNRSGTGRVARDTEPLEIPFIEQMFFTAPTRNLTPEAELRVVGEETVAGRKTIQVEWLEGSWKLRAWLDRQTGLALRMQSFGGPFKQTLYREAAVSRFETGVNFENPDLFNPALDWQGRFADDPRGLPRDEGRREPTPVWPPAQGHEPLPLTPAPPKLDISRSPLTFQYGKEDEPVELFAGGYHLGSLPPLPARTELICDRSADGLRLAFAGGSGWRISEFAPEAYHLGWLELKSPLQITWGFFGLEVEALAFAPSGGRLAVFVRSKGLNDPAGIYILNTENGASSYLLPLFYLWGNLIWSPDGESLAFIGGERSQYNLESLILDISSGEITYRSPAVPGLRMPTNEDPDWLAPGWPGREWTADYPLSNQSLDRCVTPKTP